MTAFEPDRKITDILKEHDFTISAEIIPPRNGANQGDLLGQILRLTEAGAYFLAVTKGAGGSLRGGSLPIAQLIKERFQKPCIAHFTCRDISPEEVENQLVDHHYFGIRNILALRGDPPQNQPDWKPRPDSYPYAHQLITQIKLMNEGTYLERPGFKTDNREATDFCIGAAVYPDHVDQTERLEFFKQKVSAGAEYAITQMLFDADSYSGFLDMCARSGINTPILPGARILKSKKQAEKMAKRFEFSLPSDILARLPDEDSPTNQNQVLDCFYYLVEKLKRAGAPGMHLFVLSDLDLSCLALKELGGSVVSKPVR